jgi:ACS family tartrate transporter-like MFS transporter
MNDGATERTVLSRVSWRILPLIALGYGVSYMDRINISFAAARMNEDLGFSAAIYGLGSGLFFLSYALFEVPSNMLLVKFGARRWLARIMFTWGLLSVAMMFVRTPTQFYAARFFLGLAEAGFFPGAVFYLSQWFPSAHVARAVGRFYVAIPLVSIVMGAVAGALLGLDGRLGLSGWQWLFLVEGAPAVLLSVVFLFLLPDRPATVPWLADGEKAWLETRLAADAAARGLEEHSFFKALANPVVLVLGAANFLMLGGYYAFTFSAPMLLDGATGLGATRVGYVISFGGFVGAVSMLLATWHSDRRRERILHTAVPLAVTAAAFAVMAGTQAPAVVLAAYLVSVAGIFAYSPTLWAVAHEHLPPRSAAISVAGINTVGQVGSFVAPYAWGLSKDLTGSFQAGLTALPIPFLVAAALILLVGWRARARRTVPAASA